MAGRRVSFRKVEDYSRSRIPRVQRSERLETRSSNFQSTAIVALQSRNRSFCKSKQLSATSILQLETRPWSRKNRCLFRMLDGKKSVRFPSIHFNPPLSSTGDRTKSYNTIDRSCLVKPALVPTTATHAGCQANLAPPAPESAVKSIQCETSLSSEPQSTASCMDCLYGSEQANQISERAKEILRSSIRPNTKRSYASAWKSFVCWCDGKHLHPFSVTVSNVIEYLTYLEQRKLAYRTIN